MSNESTVVPVTGVMNSATAVYEAIEQGYEPYFLHTSYGKRIEDKAYECAKALAEEADAGDFLHIVTGHLSQIGTSSLTDEEMDVADADMESDEIPTSYVPFRDANLSSMATSYAEATGSETLFVGARSEGFSGYPDCRPAFFDAFQNVIDVGTKPETEIAERGSGLGVPYEMTWSCYRDEEPACGTCDACAFRLEAFRNAGSRDPVAYAERPEFS
ncbi:7-cyano-7-deazaguanine synthase [Halorubrum sp. Ib24]|uniref:7-cyano-7-deazaguanine synthase n=1 Tax=unclassified Halorubrum TaxID=2642239 RepID=UPI000B97EBA3|nr:MULTISPECIES: 7-cyano-7-deazaguanine synthase [unclassified Halorubrum]OYR42212.1 7-cyano-7-deazaguanine synthase [Halorubrum sp. Ib24]OYR43994.1 7-cyano-7-deazaguanine synthase [Halorubrum sp. Eb13]